MNAPINKNVYTIPPGIPFAKELAARLLKEVNHAPEKLTEYRILLPTRRACRTLREAFLKLTHGKPILLPRMHPIGDIDEEELALHFFDEDELNAIKELPPAIPSLKRQLLLARTIEMKPDFNLGHDQAIALASSLGQLMDRILIEELDINNLDKIVPDDFADHWQITLIFLKIIIQEWPKILAEEGYIDAAERRNKLIRLLTAHWEKHPPKTKIIAGGSTGSNPATADLLDIISAMPNGRLILPGLDCIMDDESWENLEPSHPQYGLRNLLRTLNLSRSNIKNWGQSDCKTLEERRYLASELMRPASTAQQWEALGNSKSTKEKITNGLNGLKSFTCANPREEANLISVLLREALEDKTKTAAVITPDRELARRIAITCKRWDISLDDSAGQTLAETPIGTFLQLTAQSCLSHHAPVCFLALLKHNLCTVIHKNGSYRKAINKLEFLHLHGQKPNSGLNGINTKIQAVNDESSEELLKIIEPILSRFTFLISQETKADFSELLDAHIRMVQDLSPPNEPQGETHKSYNLWAGNDGEAASVFLAELRDYAKLIPPVSGTDYLKIIQQLMRAISVRPSYGTHPRLMILGQLEARLIDADLIIMAGLNEGTWPPDPGHDPWMSRPMRKSFGIPAPERSIGLAAHDFVQGFCNAQTILTRSKRVNASPTVPARWLQRLDTVLKAAQITPDLILDNHYILWAQTLDQQHDVTPYKRPEPSPPINQRPARLPVTQVETWMKDPYSIYARHILKLKKLRPLEEKADAATRGILIHDILDRFITAYPNDLPDESNQEFIKIAKNEVEKLSEDSESWDFWWPRLINLGNWFINHEKSWRNNAKPLKTEQNGTLNLQKGSKTFVLSARADRIDRMQDGTIALIDYKSGGTYTKKSLITGSSPQLPLEAAIMLDGGFDNISASSVGTLAYWKLTGGAQAGKITQVQLGDKEASPDEIAANAKDGLQNLINVFEMPDTPYYSLPEPEKAPRFNDYELLARVKEWAALDDTEEVA